LTGVFVDSNVILDVFEDDPRWVEWSESTLDQYSATGRLYINSIVYAEVSIGFHRIEDLEAALNGVDLRMVEIPKESLFLAGKAFMSYRQRGGARSSPLPDFFIGAHAAVADLPLITRDVTRYQTYFPGVGLISP
jgi:predicted nucleic acid-binding protein